MAQNTPQYEIGMIFGIFDGFHDGHRHFVEEAASHCQKLIVVVGHPDVIQTLKNSAPRYSQEERMAEIRKRYPHHTVVPGDAAIHTWSALKKYRPDIVFVGYDQHTLAQELAKIDTPCLSLAAYHPDKYKSSLLNKNIRQTGKF